MGIIISIIIIMLILRFVGKQLGTRNSYRNKKD
jgi:hypothetical protein